MKVSIIIPVFNAEKYINKCIDSLLAQTYSNIEIICIDDESTDSSVDVIKSYDDNRIILHCQKNGGAYLARKKGFELSNGNYICFVDADDWVEKDYIEILINKAIEYNCDVVRMGFIKNFVEEGRERKDILPYNDSQLILRKDYNLKLFPILVSSYFYNSMCCQIINRKCISFSDNPNKIIMGEDFLFNLSLFDKTSNIYIVNANKYHYRYNRESVTICRDKDSIIKKSNDIIYVYSELKRKGIDWNFDNILLQKCDERIIKEFINQMSYLFFIKNLLKNYSNYKSMFFIDDINNIIISLKNIKIIDKEVKLFIKKPYFYYLNKKYIYVCFCNVKKLLKFLLGGLK